MSNYALKVRKLGKEYRLGERIKYDTLRDNIAKHTWNTLRRFASLIKRVPVSSKLSPGIATSERQRSQSTANHSKENYIWSLKDVSFDVKQGEILGIIGRNGAGKSTLLKIISGITEPTEGRVDIYGRIGSLLEVGTGFHYELTGRENIYLNGAILGMRKREIDRKFDDIVEFAGIEEFIDTPVKFYSSGMGVRLGFSVAAHLEPEILLLDEVLAVGDAEFQKKCLGKLDNVATSDGRTVLFVSHDMTAIQSLCERTILIDDGKIVADGPTIEIIEKYLTSISLIESTPLYERTDIDRSSDRSVMATSLKIENEENGKPILPRSRIIFKIGYKSEQPVRNLSVQLKIRDFKSGIVITTLDSSYINDIPETLPPEGTLVCLTDENYFTSGRCRVDLQIYNGMQRAYRVENAGFFDVEKEIVYGTSNVSRYYGMFFLKHKWSIDN